jgi:hypothetical protein
MYCQPCSESPSGKGLSYVRAKIVSFKPVRQPPKRSPGSGSCRLSDKARCDPPNKTYQGLPPLPVPSPRAHGSSTIMNSEQSGERELDRVVGAHPSTGTGNNTTSDWFLNFLGNDLPTC